jgi:ribosomal protein S11
MKNQIIDNIIKNTKNIKNINSKNKSNTFTFRNQKDNNLTKKSKNNKLIKKYKNNKLIRKQKTNKLKKKQKKINGFRKFKTIYFFKKRNFIKFLKWKKRRNNRKVLKYILKKKLKRFRKYLYYKFFTAQIPYILRLCFTRTNLFFVCTNLWGDVVFWFTSKQLGFRRYQLKSPYTIDAFNSLLVYYLKFHKIINFNIFFLGYNRHKKRFIKDLFELRFVITSITRYIPLTYNGCKRKHKRRK